MKLIQSKNRVGRGGKKGTYSGRGQKGQKSRSGANFRPITKKLFKKYHKLRGYKFHGSRKEKPVAVNLSVLNSKFKEGDIVTPGSLLKLGLISKTEERRKRIKILGQGKIDKKLIIKNCLFSKSAKEKIEKAKGKIEK